MCFTSVQQKASEVIPVIPPPAPPEYSMGGEDLRVLIRSVYPEIEPLLWDGIYYYVSLVDWGTILKNVAVNMPAYTTEKFDCENFAMLTSGRVAEKHKLNTCGIAIGDSPMGYHGYNLFVAQVDGKAALYLYEPQNGMVYEPNNPEGYIPRMLILG